MAKGKKDEGRYEAKDGEIGVLVTTERRGIFFGYATAADIARVPDTKTLAVKSCRNAWQWKTAQGFLGLASIGPQEGSKIGARAPESTLTQITSVSRCTPEAIEAWESAQWAR